MIFTRRFGALAARPQFPDAPELQELDAIDLELRELTERDVREDAGESAA